ncbi:MAG: hypothetical protein CMI78_01290 [Candidatus Pelagibacter sp.]|nr:hypothetical protein [Candidatus Pelagibacter sp.]OUW68192.1 MAG: hypothetical protein CBD62_02295 [Candidatus Pelagibacter sp. TMED202]
MKKKKFSYYIFTGNKNYKKIKYLIKKYKPNFFIIFDDITYNKIKKENNKKKSKNIKFKRI